MGDGDTTAEIVVEKIRKALSGDFKQKIQQQINAQLIMLNVSTDIYHLIQGYQAYRGHRGLAHSEVNKVLFWLQTRRRTYEDNIRSLKEELHKK